MTRRRPCADEFWWEPSFAPTSPGSVHDLSKVDGPNGQPVVLWVPDIDARHRWREKYVYPDEPKPERRMMGFVPNKGKP